MSCCYLKRIRRNLRQPHKTQAFALTASEANNKHHSSGKQEKICTGNLHYDSSVYSSSSSSAIPTFQWMSSWRFCSGLLCYSVFAMAFVFHLSSCLFLLFVFGVLLVTQKKQKKTSVMFFFCILVLIPLTIRLLVCLFLVHRIFILLDTIVLAWMSDSLTD